MNTWYKFLGILSLCYIVLNPFNSLCQPNVSILSSSVIGFGQQNQFSVDVVVPAGMQNLAVAIHFPQGSISPDLNSVTNTSGTAQICVNTFTDGSGDSYFVFYPSTTPCGMNPSTFTNYSFTYLLDNCSTILSDQAQFGLITTHVLVFEKIRIFDFNNGSNTFYNFNFNSSFNNNPLTYVTGQGTVFQFEDHYPKFSMPQVNDFLVNKGETIQREIRIPNDVGTTTNGSFDGHFTFTDISNNPAIQITNVSCSIGNNNPVAISPNFNSTGGYSFDVDLRSLSMTIQPGEELIITETINIVDCLTLYECPNSTQCPCASASTQTNQSQFEFGWGGASNSSICMNLNKCAIITRSSDRPLLRFTRIEPIPAIPSIRDGVWEDQCPGETTQWAFRISNEGAASIYDVTIDLKEGIEGYENLINSQSLPYGDPNTIYIKNNLGLLVPLSNFSPVQEGLSSQSQSRNCYSTISSLNPLSRFMIVVNQLIPGDYYDIYFSTIRCCPNDLSLLNSSVYLNKYYFDIFGFDECGLRINKSNVSNPYFPTPAYGDGKSISLNDNQSPDLRLQQELIPPTADMTGLMDPPACNPDEAKLFKIRNVSFERLYPEVAGLFSSTYNTDEDEIILEGKIKVTWDLESGLRLVEDPDPLIPNDEIMITNGNLFWYPNLPFNYNIFNNPISHYEAEFNFSDIPIVNGNSHGNSLKNIREFIYNSNIQFGMMPCCQYHPGANTYTIRTFILAERTSSTSTCNSCWIPLAESGNVIDVHCPGCKTPGIYVSNSKLERSDNPTNGTYSYGTQDIDNDGRQDIGAINIDEQYRNDPNHLVRSNFSIAGDYLKSTVYSSFDDGRTSLVNQGFTYNELRNCYGTLTHLILEQQIKNSGPAFFNLVVHSCNLRIIRPNSNLTPLPNNTMGGTYIDLNIQPFIVSPSLPTDDEFFYDLSLVNLKSLAPNDLLLYEFEPSDQFVVETYFKVCNNFHAPDQNGSPSDARHESHVENIMYLTGAPQVYGTAITAPSSAWTSDHVSLCLSPTNCNPHCNPPSVDPTPITLNSLYKCQAYGSFHYFLETNHKNNSVAVDNEYGHLGNKCSKYIYSSSIVSIGGNAINSFPYEFRKPDVTGSYRLNLPNQYTLSDITNLSSTGTYFYTYGGPCFPNTLNQSRLFSSATIPVTLGCSGAICNSSSAFNTYSNPTNFLYSTVTEDPNFDNCNVCNGQTDAELSNCQTQLAIGDEYFKQEIFLSLTPNCPFPIGMNNTEPFDETIIEHKFVSDDHCQSSNSFYWAGSEYISGGNAGVPTTFTKPLPNLRISGVSTVTATSHQITYTVRLFNDVPQYTTVAENVFLEFPVNSNYQILSITNSGCGTVNQSAVNPEIWDLGDIAAAQYCDYTIEVQLNNCVSPASGVIAMKWGWNCDGTPLNANDACYSVSTDLNYTEAQSTFNASILTINGVVAPFLFNTCSNNIFEIGLTPGSNGAVNDINVTLSLPAELNLSSPVYTMVYTNSLGAQTVTGNISSGNIIDLSSYDNALFHNDGFYGLQNGESITITFELVPTCDFIDIGTFPSIIVNANKFCGAALPPIDITSQANWQFGVDNCTPPCSSPFQVQILSNATSVFCPGTLANTTLTAKITPATSGITYSWSPVIGNTASIAVSPTSTTTYTVTATDVNGTTVTATYTITFLQSSIGCCIPSDFNSVNGDWNFSDISSSDAIALIGSNVLHTSNIILINGVFTVDQDFTFDICTHIIMGPGALIDVLPNAHLILYDCNISSCSDMSKGILLRESSAVSPGGKLDMKGTMIKDAQYGVEARNGSILSCISNIFENNFAGIYFPSPPNGGTSVVNSYIIASDFKGTSILKAPYQNQTPTRTDHAFAGIWANNLVYLQLSPFRIANKFTNMNFGILAEKTNVKVETSKFYDIRRLDNVLGFQNCLGSGICLKNQNLGYKLTQIGDNDPGDKDFVNCKFGVYTQYSSVKSQYSYFENCDIGYTIYRPLLKDVLISENTIDANLAGVALRQCEGFITLDVSSNTIDVGQRQVVAGGASMFGHGIIINGQNVSSPQPNSEGYIYGNNIHLWQYGRNGISCLSMDNLNINHNFIHMNGPNTNLYGINIQNSKDNLIKCNYVDGLTSNSSLTNQSAFRFIDSPHLDVSCNESDNTFNGYIFEGSCTGTNGLVTNITANDIGHHNIGLLYKDHSSVDEQYLQGNLWRYPCDIIDAWNRNSPIQVGLEQYTVSNNPSTSNFGVNLPPNRFPYYWFQQDAGTDGDCDITWHHDVCLTTSTGSGNSRIAEDINLIYKDEGNSEFDKLLTWKNQVNLFEKLLNFPSYLDSSYAIDSFFVSNWNSNLQKLAQINKEKKELFDYDDLLLTQIGMKTFSVAQMEQAISVIDSLLLLPEFVTKKDSLIILRGIKYAGLKNAVSYIQLLVDSISIRSELKGDLLNTKNTALIDQEVYESNDKTMNEIYLNSIYSYNDTELSNFQTVLFSIASQCPLIGGPAVYRARSLFWEIDPSYEFDDDNICMSEGYIFRKGEIQTYGDEYLLFPNPAVDKIQIYSVYSGTITIQLFNAHGQIVLATSISGEGLSTIDVSGLSIGLYGWRILNQNGNKEKSGRVMIVR